MNFLLSLRSLKNKKMEKITKEKYLEAQKIVDEYRNGLMQSFVKDYVCICCKENKIELLCKDKLQGFDPLMQEQEMWNGGTVELISFGYGSSHDSESYYMSICDNCVEKLVAEHLILKYRDLKKDVRLHLIEKTENNEEEI